MDMVHFFVSQRTVSKNGDLYSRQTAIGTHWSSRVNMAVGCPFSRKKRNYLRSVVEHTMAVLFPSLPVVGYSAAILEGVDATIHIGDVGVESVAIKTGFNPARREGYALILCHPR